MADDHAEPDFLGSTAGWCPSIRCGPASSIPCGSARRNRNRRASRHASRGDDGSAPYACADPGSRPRCSSNRHEERLRRRTCFWLPRALYEGAAQVTSRLRTTAGVGFALGDVRRLNTFIRNCTEPCRLRRAHTVESRSGYDWFSHRWVSRLCADPRFPWPSLRKENHRFHGAPWYAVRFAKGGVPLQLWVTNLDVGRGTELQGSQHPAFEQTPYQRWTWWGSVSGSCCFSTAWCRLRNGTSSSTTK